jgi:hypothetical protein
MKRFSAIAGVLAVTATLAAAVDARMQAPSGATCTFTGSGTTYTVNIASGAGVQQYRVAFGAPGVTVTAIGISGKNGTFTNTGLAPKTTGAWTSDELLTGTLAATLTVTGTATGPFIIVPSTASQYYDPVTCTRAAAAPSKTVSFKVAPRPTYDASVKAWHLVVTIPVAGVVSAVQPLPPSTALHKTKSLVQTKKRSLNSGGKITLTLKPTPAGQAVLAAKNALTVNLRVAFDAKDGRTGHKTVALTLHK